MLTEIENIAKPEINPFKSGITKPLIDLCDSITDCHHSTPEYLDEGYLVIRNYNIKKGRLVLDNLSFTTKETFQERISRSKPEPGDLIITREAPIGEVCIIPEGVECCLGQRMVLIKPNNRKVDNQYLLYALLSQYVQAQIKQSEGTGSIVSNLRIPLLKEINIPYPSLEIQKKIGFVLSTIDAKIELNNRINAELEAMAKTLYDYWFVQFDFPSPLTPNGGINEGKPYKSSGGTMVWNEELKREIPEGWEVKCLRQFANTSSGGTPLSTNKEYYENGNIPWINSGELNSPYIVEGKKFITKEGLSNSSAKIFSENTLLVAMYGATAGKVSLLQIPASTNQAVCAVIPYSKIQTNFLKFAFEDLYKHLINLSTGSARDNLSQDVIGDLNFIISKEELLKKFNEIINPMIDKISTNLKENQQLAELRDWLLPMLMNGQVKVQ